VNDVKGNRVKSVKGRERRSKEMKPVNIHLHDQTREDVEGLMLRREGEENQDEALKEIM